MACSNVLGLKSTLLNTLILTQQMVLVAEALLLRIGMLHHQGAAPALTCFPGDLALASHFPESPGPVWQSPAPQTPEGASTPGPHSIWPQGLHLLRPQQR